MMLLFAAPSGTLSGVMCALAGIGVIYFFRGYWFDEDEEKRGGKLSIGEET